MKMETLFTISLNLIGTDSPSSPISSSSPKPVLSPQQYGHYSLQNHVSSEYIK
jgi:hypothetical protein